MVEKKSAFTLAEVLIVITIIGVIATQTIPVLVKNIQNLETVTRLKKGYSVLQQAYVSFIADGTDMDTVWSSAGTDTKILNQFATKLRVIKNCGRGQGCLPDVHYSTLNGDPYWNINRYTFGAKAILADGSIIYLLTYANCNNDYNSADTDTTQPIHYVCGEVYMDINGFKGPNQYGRDMFVFFVSRKGILPADANNDVYECTPEGGEACTGRVLAESAVNY